METKTLVADPHFIAEHPDGLPVDTAVLDQNDVAYDPTQMTVDLTKAEKRRTTALMLAINAYQNIIIKDADYLREMHNEARRENGPVIQPATMHAMVEAAIEFDMFIAGKFEQPALPENTEAGDDVQE